MAEVRRLCGRLQMLRRALILLDAPLVDALGDVERRLWALGEALRSCDHPHMTNVWKEEEETLAIVAMTRTVSQLVPMSLAQWQVVINTRFGFQQRRN